MLDSISEVDDLCRFDRLREPVGGKAFRLARTLPGDEDDLETVLWRTDLRTQRILATGSGRPDADFISETVTASNGGTLDCVDQW